MNPIPIVPGHWQSFEESCWFPSFFIFVLLHLYCRGCVNESDIRQGEPNPMLADFDSVKASISQVPNSYSFLVMSSRYLSCDWPTLTSSFKSVWGASESTVLTPLWDPFRVSSIILRWNGRGRVVQSIFRKFVYFLIRTGLRHFPAISRHRIAILLSLYWR